MSGNLFFSIFKSHGYLILRLSEVDLFLGSVQCHRQGEETPVSVDMLSLQVFISRQHGQEPQHSLERWLTANQGQRVYKPDLECVFREFQNAQKI